MVQNKFHQQNLKFLSHMLTKPNKMRYNKTNHLRRQSQYVKPVRNQQKTVKPTQ